MIASTGPGTLPLRAAISSALAPSWTQAKKVPATRDAAPLAELLAHLLDGRVVVLLGEQRLAHRLLVVEVGHGHLLEVRHRGRCGIGVGARAGGREAAIAVPASRRAVAIASCSSSNWVICACRHPDGQQRRPGDLVLALVVLGELGVEVLPGAMERGRAGPVAVRERGERGVEPAQVAAYGAVDDLVHAHAGVAMEHGSHATDRGNG